MRISLLSFHVVFNSNNHWEKPILRQPYPPDADNNF